MFQMEKNKYISTLKLKFLDMKFLTVDTTDHSVNYSIRDKQKSLQLPCITNKRFDSDQFSILQNHDNYNSKRTIKTKTILKTGKSSCTNQPVGAENIKLQSQINKYRIKIEQLRKENQAIHSEIVGLYQQKEKHRDINLHVKRVKNIQLYKPSTIPKKTREVQSQKLKADYINQNFYQNLYEVPDKAYQQKLNQLKEKFISSSMPKNFEQYLIHKNKRVPEFLKRIR